MNHDEFLKFFGFVDPNTGRPIESYDELNSDEERETFKQAYLAHQQAQITPDKVEAMVKKNKRLVEEKLGELAECEETPENWAKFKLLAARMINYISFEKLFEEPNEVNRKIERMSKGETF